MASSFSNVLENANTYDVPRNASLELTLRFRDSNAKSHFNKHKAGCMTCRRRHVFCDERHPTCNECTNGGFACEGYRSEVQFEWPQLATDASSAGPDMSTASNGDESQISLEQPYEAHCAQDCLEMPNDNRILISNCNIAPVVSRRDRDGVQWIAFEYTWDRVKMEYTIRCDIESIKTSDMSLEFKTDNCVYPATNMSRERYKGHRLAYESEYNMIGWALVKLNPCLRAKRDLIATAVHNWRNAQQDSRLPSVDALPEIWSTDQQLNLDFSTLEANDVLENFDFDSFLKANDSTDTFSVPEIACNLPEPPTSCWGPHKGPALASLSAPCGHSDFQAQSMLFEQQNRERLMTTNAERDRPVSLAMAGGPSKQGNQSLQGHMQLDLLEQHNKQRLAAAHAPQGASLSTQSSIAARVAHEADLPAQTISERQGNHALQDYQMQLMLLEQQNKKRLLAGASGTIPSRVNYGPEQDSRALQDYQMQLMLLEQQNKKRLLMAREEQDRAQQDITSDAKPDYRTRATPQNMRTDKKIETLRLHSPSEESYISTTSSASSDGEGALNEQHQQELAKRQTVFQATLNTVRCGTNALSADYQMQTRLLEQHNRRD